ncbi:steroid 17-alpha-hydroxylase/17,20 lyase-like isoform X2 [Anneissia japonica]|uniref:steroid 17-alpha-hydroxylase/17,20 lyase-like isoform X2 n=1 Tax=Anneissia japonica TaxID=1529436 RepID=UPI001425B298|nr:steroid 17-alpha-hydroxylase/17,20 lyase-like isoform X2 [Anneissia japonica]
MTRMIFQFDFPSSPAWLLLLAIMVATWLYINVRRPPGLPPGPFPYPIIGSTFDLIGDVPPYKTFKRMSETYGNVFSIKLGSYWAVVVNNYELVHEVLLTKPNDCSGRPRTFLFDWYTDDKQDITAAQPTSIWKHHRMLAHSAIRKFASGEYLQNVTEQIRPLLQEIMTEKLKGPFDPHDVVGFAVYNAIATMCFGHRYEVNDPRLNNIMKNSRKVVKGLGNGWTADFIPWFRHVPNPYFYIFKKDAAKFHSLILNEIECHRESFDPDLPAKDFLDILLKSQKEDEDEGKEDDVKNRITNVNIKQIMSDIFLAGVDTQTTTLLWGIAILVDNPDVQEKIQKEIDEALGERPPKLSDRGKLPYTEATIMELFRYRTVSRLALAHLALVDTTIGPYKIPADTIVFLNLWALHNDPKYWPSPEKFQPERFLDSSNTVIQRLPSFLPFSTGRRVCVGESLAKANIFLTFVWLIQNYIFSKPEGVEGPVAVHDKPGVVNVPKPYKVLAKSRNTVYHT